MERTIGEPRPLVVTLALDAGTQRRFDAERAQWFPAGRTEVGAHVTLFHALPGDRERTIRDDLADVAGTTAPFRVRAARVIPLGRGVAYLLEGPRLVEYHRVLQRRWWDGLTRQDRQPLRPHVTVQNKVTPERARATLAELERGFTPFDADAIGVDLWRYDGGPWTPLTRVPFVP